MDMSDTSIKKNNNDIQYADNTGSPESQNLNLQTLYSIINSFTNPMLIINRGLEIIWNNQVTIELYGDQKGKKCGQFLKPNSHRLCSQKTYCVAEQTILDGQRHSGEFSVLTQSEEKHCFLVTSSAIQDKTETSQLFLLTLEDITYKKNMEHDINRLMELHQEVIRVIPLSIQLLDRDLKICYWNPTMEKMMGISASNVQGKKFSEIFPAIIKPEMMKKALESALKKGKPFFKQSNRQLLPNGSEIYYNLNIFPLKDSNGLVNFILICLEDITEQKSIETLLGKKTEQQAKDIKEWEKNFHALVENCQEGIGIIKGVSFSYLNPSLAMMLGYKNPKELIGQTLKTIHPDESWEIIQDRIEKIRQGKSIAPQLEIKATKKDGTIIDLDVSTSDLYIDGERTALATFRDITEKKKAEESEKKLHEHILHSDRLAAMGRFSAGIAHEINNPLAVLSGRIQELLQTYEQDEKLRYNFASMKRVCDRIGKIVDSLLFFSKQKIEPKYLHEINEVIEDAISMFERQTVGKGVRLIKHYTPDLPPVVITATQIQQVCVNLLINAIDATKVGDTITISTKLDKKQKNITVTFKDSGCGISKKYLPKIFDPFFTTKEIDKGSGLGLSISSGIIKDHHGTIRVRSKEGSGTIFTITLPLPTQEEVKLYSLNASAYRL